MDFETQYMMRATAAGFSVIDAGFSMYDVLWVLAKALNSTMAMVESGDITHTGCSDLPGSLVSLDAFNHTNVRMGCLMRWNLQNTNFSGVSVSPFIPKCHAIPWYNAEGLDKLPLCMLQ